MPALDTEINIQAVAPDYEVTIVTIRTGQFESRWMVPLDPPDPHRMERLLRLHDMRAEVARKDEAAQRFAELTGRSCVIQ